VNERQARTVGAARQVALTVGAVLGTLCILVTLAAVVLDVRPLVFRSGSMSPTIGTGALALAHRVDGPELEVGQVVSVPTRSGERVTHRIQSVQHDGDRATLVLKGDANRAPDAEPYVVTHADEVVFSVPWLGYAAGWLAGPVGLFVLGLYAAFLVSVIVRPGTARSRAGGRHSAAAGVSTLTLLVAAGLVAGTTLHARTTPTMAAWSDPATVSGTTTTAYTVPAPDGSSCALLTPGSTSSRGVNLTWPTPTKGTSYTTSVTGITATRSLVTVGSNQQLQVRYNPGTSANQSKIATVTATPNLTATTSWTGPTTTWKFRTGNNQNAQPTCGEATPAVVDIVAPDGATRTPTAERTFISGASGCTFDIAFCGTIDDASTISTVTYVLKRTQGSTVRCFSGTAWVPTCNEITAQSTVYQNKLSFYDDATTATVYPNSGTGSYTLTITVTDSWSNVTTTSVSFTLN
jgi:signal peptidase I